ncbi:MAG: CHAD domain-containing protein, partial [Acidimicrobiia bacterium]|nr:CHAD domain-containing protein [Acidimicrobiia bacterium]
LRVALDGSRYFGLLEHLETLAANAPLTSRAEGPADELLVQRLAHALGRFDRAIAVHDDAGSPEARTDQLRSVGKAARRARCATEALEPRFERRARRLAARLRAVQEAIDEHRDSEVARQALSDIAAAAHAAGESAFTYGILHGIERDRAEEATQAFDAARRSLGPPKVLRWASG